VNGELPWGGGRCIRCYSVTCTVNAEVAGKRALHRGRPELSPVVKFRTKLKGIVLPGGCSMCIFSRPATAGGSAKNVVRLPADTLGNGFPLPAG